MAQAVTTGTPEHPRHIVKMEPGERISLCRCFASERLPFCDGAHRQMPGKGPVVVETLESEKNSAMGVTLDSARA